MSFIVILFLVAVVILLVKRLERKRRPGEPPLEQGWIPFLGKAIEFSQHTPGLLSSCQQKWGDIFTIHIIGKYMTFILNPLHYPFVLQHKKKLSFNEFSTMVSSKAFGHPPVNDLKIPGFSKEIHNFYHYLQGNELNILNESTMQNLQSILKKEQMWTTEWRTESMYDFCCRVMIETSYISLYGKAPNDEQKQIIELNKKFHKFDRMVRYLFAMIPIELLGNTKTIRKELINYFLGEKLDQRLNMANIIQKRKNLLEQCSHLLDHQRAAHHFTLLWASLANTVPASFWALYYLVKNPEALAAVQNEIDHVLQATGQRVGPDFNISLNKEDLDSMRMLGSAVNESLRLCSSSLIIRVAQEDFTIKLEEEEGIKLRKGDFVVFHPMTMHMDPEIYEDPEVYKYNRFVENGMEKTAFYKGGKKLRHYLMPFGCGISMCPGRHFAVSEIKMFLSLMLASFDMEIVQGEKSVGFNIASSCLGVLSPDSDVLFRYKLRQ
ncbi:cytochrome P450 7B1 isoform X2 [Heptranchias perlo]|uniref:cytochrome P450 7B1 isoform X2 n=1 Tax=Heptranchias perlo TaxID=212740 RepID=UPI0035594409